MSGMNKKLNIPEDTIAAVIGHPIAHSRSPLIHNSWLEQQGISGRYETIDVTPAALPSFCDDLRHSHLKGINVTIPHKEKIIPLCDEIDDTAQKIGAVNTISIKEGKLHGTNTDAYGFIRNLQTSVSDMAFKDKKALVLGAGGACRAVLYGLIEQGMTDIRLTNRTTEKARALAAEFKGVRVIPWDERADHISDIDLLVNTTSLGMHNQLPLEMNLDSLSSHTVVTDLIYNPLQTDLLKRAAGKGCPTVGGLGMLVYQAEKAFSLWFGDTPDITDDLIKELEDSL